MMNESPPNQLTRMTVPNSVPPLPAIVEKDAIPIQRESALLTPSFQPTAGEAHDSAVGPAVLDMNGSSFSSTTTPELLKRETLPPVRGRLENGVSINGTKRLSASSQHSPPPASVLSPSLRAVSKDLPSPSAFGRHSKIKLLPISKRSFSHHHSDLPGPDDLEEKKLSSMPADILSSPSSPSTEIAMELVSPSYATVPTTISAVHIFDWKKNSMEWQRNGDKTEKNRNSETEPQRSPSIVSPVTVHVAAAAAISDLASLSTNSASPNGDIISGSAFISSPTSLPGVLTPSIQEDARQQPGLLSGSDYDSKKPANSTFDSSEKEIKSHHSLNSSPVAPHRQTAVAPSFVTESRSNHSHMPTVMEEKKMHTTTFPGRASASVHPYKPSSRASATVTTTATSSTSVTAATSATPAVPPMTSQSSASNLLLAQSTRRPSHSSSSSSKPFVAGDTRFPQFRSDGELDTSYALELKRRRRIFLWRLLIVFAFANVLLELAYFLLPNFDFSENSGAFYLRLFGMSCICLVYAYWIHRSGNSYSNFLIDEFGRSTTKGIQLSLSRPGIHLQSMASTATDDGELLDGSSDPVQMERIRRRKYVRFAFPFARYSTRFCGPSLGLSCWLELDSTLAAFFCILGLELIVSEALRSFEMIYYTRYFLLLSLLLVYSLTFFLLGIHWTFATLCSATTFIAYLLFHIIYFLISSDDGDSDDSSGKSILSESNSEFSYLFLLYAASFQLFCLVAFAYVAYQQNKKCDEEQARKKLLFQERRKGEKLLRSMLPPRILNEFLDHQTHSYTYSAAIQDNALYGMNSDMLAKMPKRKRGTGAHLYATATIGYCQIELGATLKREIAAVNAAAQRRANQQHAQHTALPGSLHTNGTAIAASVSTAATTASASVSSLAGNSNLEGSPIDVIQKLHDTFKRIDGIVSLYKVRGIDKIETVSKTYLLCAGLNLQASQKQKGGRSMSRGSDGAESDSHGREEGIEDHASAMIDVSLEIMNMIQTRLQTLQGRRTNEATASNHQDHLGLHKAKMLPTTTSSARRSVGVNLRIGIATGPVVGGVIGEKRRYFRIFGDTVNVSARMCSHAKKGEIMLSSSAYASLSEREKMQYKLSLPQRIQVKGKGEMEVYTVEAKEEWTFRFNKTLLFSQVGGEGNDKDDERKLFTSSFVFHRLLSNTALHPVSLQFTGGLRNDEEESRADKEKKRKREKKQRAERRRMLDSGSESNYLRDGTLIPASHDPHHHRTGSESLGGSGGWMNGGREGVYAVDSDEIEDKDEEESHELKESDQRDCDDRLESYFQDFSSFFVQNDLQHLSPIFFIFALAISVGVGISEGVDFTTNDSSAYVLPILFAFFLFLSAFQLFFSFSASFPHWASAVLGFLIVAYSIWAIVEQNLWGIWRGIPSAFVQFCLMLFACFVFRLQFRFLLPLVTTTLLAFLLSVFLSSSSSSLSTASRSASAADSSLLPALVLHELFALFISLYFAFVFERRQRLAFLLSYSFEREQEEMDNFLSNLLPQFVVELLTRQREEQGWKHDTRSGRGRNSYDHQWMWSALKRSSFKNHQSQLTKAITHTSHQNHSQHPQLTSHQNNSNNSGAEGSAIEGMSLVAQQMSGALTSTRFAMHFPNMTVFESDIVGYTKLVSNWPAHRTLNLLNSIFSKFDDATARCKVEKIETIGDAFMCVIFEGTPDPVLNFALLVVRLLELASIETGENLQLRIGIATGPAFGGIVGTAIPRFHLFGEAHDFAIAIEQNGRPGDIIACSATYLLAKDRYRFRKIHDLCVEGDEMYQLMGKNLHKDGNTVRIIPEIGGNTINTNNSRQAVAMERSENDVRDQIHVTAPLMSTDEKTDSNEEHKSPLKVDVSPSPNFAIHVSSPQSVPLACYSAAVASAVANGHETDEPMPLMQLKLDGADM